ncbi:hypothetical protein BEN47_06985 [Hymenobacter lapidarius]|uniref:Uncharacterized protein n=1 Tax=Hymenobacter lapidarius TaxID=1908237 RepID=A0A1G1TES5_9BACT|nr:hypothetical protein BEN47_06985 [Hymenobacter lapidarius]
MQEWFTRVAMYFHEFIQKFTHRFLISLKVRVQSQVSQNKFSVLESSMNCAEDCAPFSIFI